MAKRAVKVKDIEIFTQAVSTKADMDLISLIDKGELLHKNIKEMEKELSLIKEQLCIYCAKHSTTGVNVSEAMKLMGTNYVADVTSTESWDVSSEKLYLWLHAEARLDLLGELLKTSITGVKKYFGEALLNQLGKSSIKKFNKVTFRPKKETD
jgi:hypothetical protein